MVVEQAGIAHVARQHLHGLMTADLLDPPDVGASAGGGGDEAGAQAVAGVLRRIKPSRGGTDLDDAGDGVVGQAGVA